MRCSCITAVRSDGRFGHEPLAEFLLELWTGGHRPPRRVVRRNQPRTAALRLRFPEFRIGTGREYRFGHGQRRRYGMADPQQRHRVVRSGTPARAGALRTASGLLGFVFGADMHPRIRLCRDEGEPLPAQPRDRTVHAFHDRGRRRLCDPRCRGVRRVGLCPYAHGRPVRMRRGRPCHAVFQAAGRIREVGRSQRAVSRHVGHHLGGHAVGTPPSGP